MGLRSSIILSGIYKLLIIDITILKWRYSCRKIYNADIDVIFPNIVEICKMLFIFLFEFNSYLFSVRFYTVSKYAFPVL
jgi:hypothetical protein